MRILHPHCIHLNKVQIQKLDKFAKYIKSIVPQKTIDEAFEEDCSCTSSFRYSIYSTGLGDTINVLAFGKTCCLSIDDDGEIIQDEWELNF